jgi:hypothetical protein
MMKKINLGTLGVVACIFLSACSLGGSRADFDLKAVPGSTVFASEKDFAATVVNGRYRLFNNTWNKGATSGRYRQKIFVNEDRGKTVFGWVWKWRESEGVATYPEIQAGVSPWTGEATPDSGFPFRVGTKKLTVSYDVAMEATGKYNMAFEFWTVAGLPVREKNITHEVMIWIAGERLGAAGSEVARATIQGNAYRVNLSKNHGDASGAHQNTWTIITLIAEKPLLHGTLDIGQIIDYLVKAGLLEDRLLVANLELGNEVMAGAGTTVIKRYEVTVE